MLKLSTLQLTLCYFRKYLRVPSLDLEGHFNVPHRTPSRFSRQSMRQSGIKTGGRERNIGQVREKQKLRIVFPQLEPRSLSLRPIHAASPTLFVPRSFTLPPSCLRLIPKPTLTQNKSIHVSADYLAECSRPAESLQPNL